MPVAAKSSATAFGLLLFTALLLLGAIALASSPVWAAGEPIQVVETRQQVNFPAGVGLTVTVESDADIAEVRVFYRAAGSRTWSYAYADFAPGSRVVATRSIPVMESTYLAPGVNVEYYYEIRDVHGNVFRTAPAVVEYLDQRFDWRRVNIGALELVYHDIGDSRIAEAASALRQDLRRVEELLQAEPSDGFKGVIYNSYSDANAAFPVQSQTTTDHGTFAGYAFPGQGVFVGQGLDRRIIVHESAHLMLQKALGDRVIELPDWLNEGFATYMEPSVRVRSSDDLYGRTPPLRAMKSLSGTPETIPLFYYKSVSVVAHLIEEYGEDNFRRFLDELKAGRAVERALLNVYGFDVDGLDNSWAGLPVTIQATATPEPKRESRQQPEPPATPGAVHSGRSAPATPEPRRESQPVAETTPAPPAPPVQQQEGPSPFVFIDVWVLSGVALLAAGTVGFRFVYRRLRRTSETPDDPWQDWQEPV